MCILSLLWPFLRSAFAVQHEPEALIDLIAPDCAMHHPSPPLYKSLIVENRERLAWLCHYLQLNLVIAKICEVAETGGIPMVKLPGWENV